MADDGRLEEWAADSSSIPQKRQFEGPVCNTRRRVRLRMGRVIDATPEPRVLGSGGQGDFHQRARITSSQICNPPAHQGAHRGQTVAHLQRQYDGPQVRDQDGGDRVPIAPAIGTSGSGIDGNSATRRDLPPRSGRGQRQGRRAQPPRACTRVGAPQEPIPSDTPPLATSSVTDRRVCDALEYQASTVLDPGLGSEGRRDGRVSPILADEGALLTPSMGPFATGDPQATGGQSQVSHHHHTTMADTSVVAEPREVVPLRSPILDIEPSSIMDGMEVVRVALAAKGLAGEGGRSLAVTGWRQRTRDSYQGQWRRYTLWCWQRDPPLDPLHHSVDQVARYAISLNRQLKRSSVHSIMTCISAILTMVHGGRDQGKPSILSNPLIKRMLRSRGHSEPIPQDWHVPTNTTFSLAPIVNMIRAWGPSDTLRLHDLQRKTMFLVAIATFWRPSSDVGRIQAEDVRVTHDSESGNPIGVAIMVRDPKDARYKVSHLGFTRDPEMDPARTLLLFKKKTEGFRFDLPSDHGLWLTYLDNPGDKQPMKERTVSTTLKRMLRDAGIDVTRHKTHSLRSASSSAAAQLGVSSGWIKSHGHWSDRTKVWEQIYDREIVSYTKTGNIIQSIIDGTTTNRTTSEPRDEATSSIGRDASGTNCLDGAEGRGDEVVNTHPSAAMFLDNILSAA